MLLLLCTKVISDAQLSNQQVRLAGQYGFNVPQCFGLNTEYLQFSEVEVYQVNIWVDKGPIKLAQVVIVNCNG